MTWVGGCNETHANSSVESRDEDDNVGGETTVNTPNKVCGCLCAVLHRTVWFVSMQDVQYKKFVSKI